MNIEYLTEKYKLDQLEISILTYLYEHIETLKKIGIRKVAKDNYTSTATVIKLAKRLGFDGYLDMVYNIIFSWKGGQKDHPFTISWENYPQLEDMSKQFNTLLSAYKHKRIMITGIGFSQLVASYMNETLLIHGFNSITNVHLELLNEANKQNILLITISQSGETTRFLDIFKKAHENYIDIISFVGNKNAKLLSYATLPVIIDRNDNFNHLTHTPNTFIGEEIIVFEYLLSHYLESVQG